jgi:predicted DNA-binding transcriptional regulator AlpA
LGYAQVAKFIGGEKPVHPVTIWRAVNSGHLPKPVYPTPKCPRWIPAEVRAHVAGKAA